MHALLEKSDKLDLLYKKCINVGANEKYSLLLTSVNLAGDQ